MENLVILIGMVGKDPEVRVTDKNKICNFSLATSERYKVNGEVKEKTQWHNITFFTHKDNDSIEKYIKKGLKLYVTGKLDYQSWEHEGKKIYKTVIIGSNWKSLSKLESETAEAVEVNGNVLDKNDSELPF
jgi:single-strand DNA-binding protein